MQTASVFTDAIAAAADAPSALETRVAPPIADIPLEQLEGLTVFEQFLTVWGTPERAAILWEEWYGQQADSGKAVLDNLVTQTIEAQGVSEDEARRRLAVEKYLNDRGTDVAVKFLNAYKSQRFRAAKPLQPMTIRKRKT